MKYFVYVRKSSEEEERQALSLDSQIEKAYQLFADLELIALPPESASAFTPNNRPIFEEMLRRIDAGEAHGIIAWHPDRLSRNEVDAAAITYRLRSGKILDLKFGSYTFDNSPEGIMMLQMVMSQSQYFSAKLSKDVKRGLDRKLSLGQKPGWAPSGYLNTTDRLKGTKEIISDPDRFVLVRKMWDLMLTGEHSVPEILHIANVEWGFRTRKTRNGGGVPLSRAALYGIFRNVFYMGLFLHNGQEYKGSHPAMVSEAEFNRVQQLLGKKGNPRAKSHEFTYRGPITCGGCGAMVTAELKRKYIKASHQTKEYVYYHCTHKKPCTETKSITESELEKQIDQFLASITIIPEFRDWALEVLRNTTDQEIEARQSIVSTLNSTISSTQKQLDNLTRMRLRDLLTDEEYIREREMLSGELRKLREQLHDLEARADKWLELTEKTFNFATNARKAFSEGDVKIRRDIFTAMGQSFSLKGGHLQITPQPWFKSISMSYPALEKEFKEVRTNK